MATGTAQRGPKPAPATAEGRWLEYDEFIDKQLRKARGQVKGVELAGALMTLAAGGLLFFLAASLIDHWLIPGGLGIGGRVLLFVLFLIAAAWYIARRLAPLVIRRINPIYAADTIEKAKPSLKNSLINFLFLRNERTGIPQVVYQAVEEQAANNLQRTHVEASVDRTRLVHLGYVLLAAVALFAGYKLFSPKDPIETVGRVVMPWADIEAPTRVTIQDLQPGSRTAYLGETVEISAEVRGIGADEPVRVLYTTADRQTVDEAVTMHRAPDAFRHTGKIPSGENGLQQDIEYRIEAGDATSRTYFLTAAAAPTISVESINYEFPAYTGRAKAHVANAGDIQGLEGTRVTIHGKANQPLHSAQLVLDGTHHLELPIKPEGQNVTASFVLALDEKDRAAAKPEFTHYQLRPDGRMKPEPAQYNIAVIPDYPPEISFVAPDNDDVALPVNGSLPIKVRAQDADFALSEVTLTAELGEKTLFEQKLFSGSYAGPLEKNYIFVPAKLNLKEGDSVNYWASAKDNRTPTANEASTRHRQIRIVKADFRQSKNGTDAKQRNDQPNDGNQPPQENNPANPQNDNPQQPHNPKEADNHEPQPQQPNNANNRPNDQPDKKQQEGDRENQKPGDHQKDKQQPQDRQQPDGKQQDNKQQDNRQPSDQKQNGKQQSGDQPNGQQGGKPEKSDQQQGGGNAGKQDQSSAGGKNGPKSSGGNGENQQPQSSSSDGAGSSDKANPAGPVGKNPTGQQKTEGGQGAQPNSSQQNGAAGQQDKQTPSADDIKRLQQALDKQSQQGAGGSNQNQSSNQQSGPKGSASDKGPQGKSGGDGANKGNSQNPSTNPKGSDGPFPNGQPGTGGNKSEKPPGDQSAHQPGDSQKPSGPKQESGQKSGPNSNSGHQNKPGADKQAHGDKSETDGQTNQGQKSQPGDKTQPGNQPQPGDKTETGQKNPDNKSGAPNGSKSDGAKPDSAKPGGSKPDAGEKHSADKRNSNAENGENKAGVNDPSKEGQGAQTKAGSQPTDKKTDKPSGEKQNPGAKGGDSEKMKGTSSTGQKATDDKGSPSPQEGNRPKADKTDVPDKSAPKDSNSGDNGKSPTTSPKESSSQSQQEGDRSGNGKQGGGQGSNQAGTGGAGKNTSADEGKGVSQGTGKGEDSNKPGTNKTSEKPTGQAGNEAGNGSAASDKPADHGKTSDKPGSDQPGGGGATSGFGGNRTTPLPDSVAPDDRPISGDAANKEFAEKQFDLAIDKLKKGNPDLLKDLNWTPDDARKLAERLEQMKAAAKNDRPDGDAARKMDELLRNLGPRAGQLTRRGDGPTDRDRGLQESSDSGPPAAYLEQFQAFQQGMLRGGK